MMINDVSYACVEYIDTLSLRNGALGIFSLYNFRVPLSSISLMFFLQLNNTHFNVISMCVIIDLCTL